MVPPVLRGPFTVETYRRLGELGILREDDRVELIAEVFVVKRGEALRPLQLLEIEISVDDILG
jgi:hypothetical protein